MLMCQLCNQKEATVHFTRIVHHQKIEMYVCESCARENDQLKMNLNKLLSSIIGFDLSQDISGITPELVKCEFCGLTVEEFNRTGKMGCAECFDSFADYMETILKRVHGNVRHYGKIPKNISGQIQDERELEDLKQKLRECINKEAYEKAAEIRDEIKAVEKRQKENKGELGL